MQHFVTPGTIIIYDKFFPYFYLSVVCWPNVSWQLGVCRWRGAVFQNYWQNHLFGYAFFVKIINIEVLKDFLVNWIQIFTEIVANFEVCSLY